MYRWIYKLLNRWKEEQADRHTDKEIWADQQLRPMNEQTSGQMEGQKN